MIERGSFLALDLGGTNFRVLLITIKDGSQADMKSTIFAVSNKLMTGAGVKVLCTLQTLTYRIEQEPVYGIRKQVG